jgi:hypothetical protein
MKSKTIIPILILLIIITISIIYNTLPRLQLNGPQNMVISYRDEYEEQGVIVKNATGNYMSKIKIDSNIDTKKIGNYYVDYSLKIGGKTLHVRRNVKVIDDIDPVIKLKGEQIIKMSINKQYIEPGYIAIDEYDGDITDKVQITGEIDAENYGEYVLTYKATDNSNNQTEVNRIIKVVDEIKPKIICEQEELKIKQGTQIDTQCKAQDNYDGDITKEMKIIGDYDINTPGTYNIQYQVKDAAGNETTKDYKIIVEE